MNHEKKKEAPLANHYNYYKLQSILASDTKSKQESNEDSSENKTPSDRKRRPFTDHSLQNTYDKDCL